MCKGHILVVDDEPHVLQSIRGALAKKGYKVEGVKSAEDALKRIHSESYDVVFLDSGMPEVAAAEFCRKLRNGSQTVMVWMSGDHVSKGMPQALQAGANDYLKKPFREVDMLACLHLHTTIKAGVQRFHY